MIFLNTFNVNITDELARNAILVVCEELSKDPRTQNPEKLHLYAIPRGGMVLAQYIAYYFDIPKTNIHLCLEPDDIIQHPNDAIVCDDIFDSGETLKPFKNYDCVTLFGRKTRGWNDNVFSGIQIEHDQYVNFPWDFE